MELVKGVPITQYCDEHHLGVRERLGLFVQVCHAVQHAHQKGIIHRDLKPTNVLVAEYDERPVPKIIDFGVAKAMQKQLSEQTLFTELGQVVGTIDYMSPEQAKLNQLDIDTRSDIYSLGVLLYELLTGETPLDRQRLRSAAFDEMLRIVREEEPPKPSLRLSSSHSVASIAANRQIEPKKLSTLVRGELDWIVMKALEKDRARRYETASALAADVGRYLKEEPVEACPPSKWYRFRKLAQRNKQVLVIVSAVALSAFLVVGVVAGGLGWMARDRSVRQARLNLEVEHALDEAEKARDQALALTDSPEWWDAGLAGAVFAFKRADGLAAQEEAAIEPAVQERLEALRARLGADENDRRFVARFDEIRLEQSEFGEAVGGARFKVEIAFPAFKKAFRTHYAIAFGVTPPEKVLNALEQRPHPVRQYLVAALEFSLAYVPTEDAQAREWLAAVLRAADSDPWRKQARAAMEARDWRALGKLLEGATAARRPPVVLLGLATINDLHDWDGRTRLDLWRHIRQSYPGDFWANHYLANALHYHLRPPRLEEAIRYYTVSIAVRPRNPANYVDLGNALRGKGELDEAIAVYRQAIAELRETIRLRNYTWSYIGDHLALARLLQRKGLRDEANAEYQEAIRLKEAFADRPWTHFSLGAYYAQLGNWNDAAAAFDRGLELDPTNHDGRCLAAALHAGAGDVEGYRRTCRGMLKQFGDTHQPQPAEVMAKACLLLPDALSAADFDRVQKLAERAVTGTEKDGFYRCFVLTKGLADYRAGRHAEAANWLEQFAPSPDGWHWDATAFAVLAMAEHGRGRTEEAAAALARAKAILAKMPDPAKSQAFGVGDLFIWLHSRILCREAEGLLKEQSGVKNQESGTKPK